MHALVLCAVLALSAPLAMAEVIARCGELKGLHLLPSKRSRS